MNLNVREWKEFKTSKLFYDMQNGKANQQMLEDGNECFYVGAKKDDNGVMLHCLKDESLITKGNCIIFICNGQGSVGYANYMDVDFIGTTDIVAGYNDNLNEYTGLFLATVYSQERPKYSFGRKWKTHLADTIIKLPIQHNADGTPYIDPNHTYSEDGYVPDWQFMEDYMKSLHHKPLTTKNIVGNGLALKTDEWKEFRVGDLFEVSTTKMSVKDELLDGVIPFISRTAECNGCDGYVDVDNDKITHGHCLTIGAEGIYCFYQAEDFATGNKVYALRNALLSELSYLFIATILNKEDYKYSYGRARVKSKLENEIIKLPIQHNPDGTPYIDPNHTYSEDGYVPDWQFMEDYMKALPYGDRL